MVLFRGAHVKNNEKSQGPVCLGGVPTASLEQWNGMEWNGKRVCESFHFNLSVNLTGPSVANGLISPFAGFRSFSFTWPVALYIWRNKRKFLHEESVQLDSGFQSIVGFRIPWAGDLCVTWPLNSVNVVEFLYRVFFLWSLLNRIKVKEI